MSSDFKKCKECSKNMPKGLQSYCSYQCRDRAQRRREREKKKEKVGYWAAKADTAASLFYRARTPFCEAMGKDTKVCKGGLQWCHIKSRGNKRLRYEDYNNLVMCSGHHVYYTKRPSAWEIMVATEYPDRWNSCMEHWLEHLDWTVDYCKRMEEEYKQRLRDLEP